ncbi:Hypothetical predicted protein [Cloeon dipterum]|uniref:Uncharacterized protein n=1 Tax=Cloeon dipterum TaxID=197152 RepID=A0A8S1E6W6_9INSE|nr:Hypothetical predicted protein [Cloeon dipterum]
MIMMMMGTSNFLSSLFPSIIRNMLSRNTRIVIVLQDEARGKQPPPALPPCHRRSLPAPSLAGSWWNSIRSADVPYIRGVLLEGRHFSNVLWS